MIPSWLLIGATAALTSKGCGNPVLDVARGVTSKRTLLVNGHDRSFFLYVPSGYDLDRPTSVIYSFHGWYGTGWTQERDTQFSVKCEVENCIAVYPNGYLGHEFDNYDYMFDGYPVLPTVPGFPPGWNACGTSIGQFMQNGTLKYTCNVNATGLAPCPTTCECGLTKDGHVKSCDRKCKNKCIWGSCTDDKLFLAATMDYIEDTFCVDLDRQYIDGMSNGAMFVYEVGRSQIVSRFAAGISASGSAHVGFNTQPPIHDYYFSILDVHGALDDTIPANATKNRLWASDGAYHYVPIDKMLASYGGANDCDDFDDIVHWPQVMEGTVWCRQMYQCGSGVDVVRCSFGGGHTWPKTKSLTYADFAFEFFRNRPRVKKTKKTSLPKETVVHEDNVVETIWSDDFHAWEDDQAGLMRLIALTVRP